MQRKGPISKHQPRLRPKIGLDGARIANVVFVSGLIFVLRPENIEYVLSAWGALLILQIVLLPERRLAAILFLALTFYATTALLALKYARQNFDPWPSLNIVQSSTYLDLRCVLFAAVAVEIIFGFQRIGSSIRHAATASRRTIGSVESSLPDFLLSLALLSIGLFDWLKLASIGLATVIGGERRQFATQLLLGGNHNIQVLCIAATAFLICRIATRSIGLFPVLSLIVLWTPFLLAGSRKEAITTGAICVIMLAGILSKRMIFLSVIGSVIVFLSPTLKSANIFDSLHEFILPQYMHFSIAMGLVPPDLGGSFLDRAQFLLPNELRVTEIVDFGRAFYRLGITGVGLGASPFGEAELNAFFGSPEASFVIVFTAAVAAMHFLAKKFPIYTIVAFGLLLVFGRSDFWTYMFFVCYVSVLILLLAKFPASKKFPLPPRLDHESEQLVRYRQPEVEAAASFTDSKDRPS
jgi:hypothetical protein